MNYPEIYYSDAVKKILNSKPPLPEKPKAPEKVVEPIKPQQSSSGSTSGNGIGVFFYFIIPGILLLVFAINMKLYEVAIGGFVVVIAGIFLIKTFQWDKQAEEDKIQKYNTALSTLSYRENEYQKKYAEYQAKLSDYNREVNRLSDKDYVVQFRKIKIKKILRDRHIPQFTDKEDDFAIKKGATEEFFVSKLSNEFEIFTNQKVVFDEVIEYYPDIILKISNIYIDVEIDEPYSNDNKTPIHYMEEDYSPYRRGNGESSIDETRNRDFTENGFEVIRFAEEQICRQPNKCIAFLKKFVSNLENGRITSNSIKGFSIEKWKKEDAYQMAYNHYRDAYLNNKHINCDELQKINKPIDENILNEFILKQQVSRAIVKLTERANDGAHKAQYTLGLLFFNGKFVTKDLCKAANYFTTASKLGNTGAMFMLGICYENGYGLSKNTEKAFNLYQKVVDKKVSLAYYRLGACYYYGMGVEKNYEKASEWLIKSSEQRLLTLYGQQNVEDDDVLATIDYVKTIIKNIFNDEIIQSYYLLGLCYVNGQGVSLKSVKGIELIKKAATYSHSNALLTLGNYYYSGDNVPQDYGKALEWYQKAAEQGNQLAQFKLGKCYFNGEGVAQNYRKAVYNFRKSALQGNPKAQCNLGWIYYYGKGVLQDYRIAVQWYTKSAINGNSTAQFYLGNCNYKGEGVKKDLDKAIELYTKSAKQGNKKAQEMLERIKHDTISMILSTLIMYNSKSVSKLCP